MQISVQLRKKKNLHTKHNKPALTLVQTDPFSRMVLLFNITASTMLISWQKSIWPVKKLGTQSNLEWSPEKNRPVKPQKPKPASAPAAIHRLITITSQASDSGRSPLGDARLAQFINILHHSTESPYW